MELSGAGKVVRIVRNGLREGKWGYQTPVPSPVEEKSTEANLTNSNSSSQLDQTESIKLLDSEPSSGLFNRLLDHCPLLDPKLPDEIARDVSRTFPYLDEFNAPEKRGRIELQKVLQAIGIIFPEVGYCQGMNFVAGVLLIHLHYLPHPTFFILSALLLHYDYKRLFAPNVPLLNYRAFQFSQLVERTDYPLYETFAQGKFGFSLDMFSHQWIMTLFAYAVCPQVSGFLLDSVFLRGWCAIHEICIGLLSILGEEGGVVKPKQQGLEFKSKQKQNAESQQLQDQQVQQQEYNIVEPQQSRSFRTSDLSSTDYNMNQSDSVNNQTSEVNNNSGPGSGDGRGTTHLDSVQQRTSSAGGSTSISSSSTGSSMVSQSQKSLEVLSQIMHSQKRILRKYIESQQKFGITGTNRGSGSNQNVVVTKKGSSDSNNNSSIQSGTNQQPVSSSANLQSLNCCRPQTAFFHRIFAHKVSMQELRQLGRKFLLLKFEKMLKAVNVVWITYRENDQKPLPPMSVVNSVVDPMMKNNNSQVASNRLSSSGTSESQVTLSTQDKPPPSPPPPPPIPERDSSFTSITSDSMPQSTSAALINPDQQYQYNLNTNSLNSNTSVKLYKKLQLVQPSPEAKKTKNYEILPEGCKTKVLQPQIGQKANDTEEISGAFQMKQASKTCLTVNLQHYFCSDAYVDNHNQSQGIGNQHKSSGVVGQRERDNASGTLSQSSSSASSASSSSADESQNDAKVLQKPSFKLVDESELLELSPQTLKYAQEQLARFELQVDTDVQKLQERLTQLSLSMSNIQSKLRALDLESAQQEKDTWSTHREDLIDTLNEVFDRIQIINNQNKEAKEAAEANAKEAAQANAVTKSDSKNSESTPDKPKASTPSPRNSPKSPFPLDDLINTSKDLQDQIARASTVFQGVCKNYESILTQSSPLQDELWDAEETKNRLTQDMGIMLKKAEDDKLKLLGELWDRGVQV